MKVHHITVSGFFREEALAEGRRLLAGLLPEAELCEERLEPETDGCVFTTPLYSLKAVVSPAKKAELFLEKILGGLGVEGRKELANSLAARIDEDCNLYIMLGKKQLSEGKIALYTRDPIHLKVKLACFPKSMENALSIAQELIGKDG
ncbi:MAG: RNA-binding domain-containing protein [Candidatus Altiarchaeota archaeon]|nr:RNA-binding domain-containing protein [Candidatus Altiarchaeota archaeon]